MPIYSLPAIKNVTRRLQPTGNKSADSACIPLSSDGYFRAYQAFIRLDHHYINSFG